jgi:hypothetical protein
VAAEHDDAAAGANRHRVLPILGQGQHIAIELEQHLGPLAGDVQDELLDLHSGHHSSWHS